MKIEECQGERRGNRKGKRTNKTSALGSVVLTHAAQGLNLELGALELTDAQLGCCVGGSLVAVASCRCGEGAACVARWGEGEDAFCGWAEEERPGEGHDGSVLPVCYRGR